MMHHVLASHALHASTNKRHTTSIGKGQVTRSCKGWQAARLLCPGLVGRPTDPCRTTCCCASHRLQCRALHIRLCGSWRSVYAAVFMHAGVCVCLCLRACLMCCLADFVGPCLFQPSIYHVAVAACSWRGAGGAGLGFGVEQCVQLANAWQSAFTVDLFASLGTVPLFSMWHLAFCLEDCWSGSQGGWS